MFVVTSPDEIVVIDSYMPPQIRPEINNTDFGAYFIIAVFQGLKRSFNYEVTIERIVQSDNSIKVYVRFEEPGDLVNPMMSSPYHVVRVEKPPEIDGKEVQFILVANGKDIIKETHRFP